MRREVVETLVGGLVIAIAGAFIYMAFVSSGVEAVAGNSILAEFDDASGVVPGTEVRLAGVKIGTVTDKTLSPDGHNAIVTLMVDENYPLPIDSKARILPDGLLGGTYISLEPGGDDELMQSGSMLGFDQTQGAINVVDLLARFVVQAAQGTAEPLPQ